MRFPWCHLTYSCSGQLVSRCLWCFCYCTPSAWVSGSFMISTHVRQGLKSPKGNIETQRNLFWKYLETTGNILKKPSSGSLGTVVLRLGHTREAGWKYLCRSFLFEDPQNLIWISGCTLYLWGQVSGVGWKPTESAGLWIAAPAECG